MFRPHVAPAQRVALEDDAENSLPFPLDMADFLVKALDPAQNPAMRYAFHDCILDTDSQTLMRAGDPVAIEPQVFDLLRLLAANAGRLVTRDQIVDEVWSGRIVSESAISARIAAARKAVGDDGKAQRIIQTVSRRGLRFVAELASGTGELPVAQPSADAPPRTRFARAADGTTLAYSVTGSGPPLVMVPYFPSDMNESWTIPTERALFDALASCRTLVRFDHRGSGMSDSDCANFGIEFCADDIEAVMDAAGFDKFAVYSESGGSLTALTFAARHPDMPFYHREQILLQILKCCEDGKAGLP